MTLWDYNQMHHELRPCDVGIGLGSHDIGVATCAAELYHDGMFPLIVFTGANSPTTIGVFPRGEAVQYRDHAVTLGVPGETMLLETRATNTGENFTFTRELLKQHEIEVRSAILMSRPYQQRRAYATSKLRWPELDVICASLPLPLDKYVESIGDVNRVLNMLVGDTYRVMYGAELGIAIAQDVPAEVHEAFARLKNAGYVRRLPPADFGPRPRPPAGQSDGSEMGKPPGGSSGGGPHGHGSKPWR